MTKIYEGETVTIKGRILTVSIYVDGEEERGCRDLRFSADSGIMVEWDESGLTDDPLQGSRLTLKAESGTDREFVSLYALEPGAVKVCLSVDGEPWWRGALDVELYEEPYEKADHYDCTLTFTDFGMWERLDAVDAITDADGETAPVASLTELLEYGYGKAMRTGEEEVPFSVVSSIISPAYERGWLPEDANVCADLLMGKKSALTLSEAVNELLRPWGLRAIQRAGKIWFYDINALAMEIADAAAIRWDGESQTMGMVERIKTATVETKAESDDNLMPEFKMLATYPPGEVCIPEEVPGAPYDFGGYEPPEWVTRYPGRGVAADVHSYRVSHRWYSKSTPSDEEPDLLYEWEAMSFTLYTGRAGAGFGRIKRFNSTSWPPPYFHVAPLSRDVDSADGVACMYTWGPMADPVKAGGVLILDRDRDKGSGTAGGMKIRKRQFTNDTAREVLRIKSRWIAGITDNNERSRWNLRLTLPMVLSGNYNPFAPSTPDEGYGDNAKYCDNGVTFEDQLKNVSPDIFVPVSIVLYNKKGEAVCHYDNRANYATERDGRMISSNKILTGEWIKGDARWGDAYLQYYGAGGDLTLEGWTANRHTIGRVDKGGKNLGERVKGEPDGEKIPYPPQPGYIVVTVYEGIEGWAVNSGYDDDYDLEQLPEEERGGKTPTGMGKYSFRALAELFRWHLYKAPELKLEARREDTGLADSVRHSAWVSRAALNEEASSGSVGTIAENPAFVGAMLSSAGNRTPGYKRRSLAMIDPYETPETHLLSTLLSQGAGTRITLSGETALDPGGVKAWYEANQGDRAFMRISESADLLLECSDCTFREVVPDTIYGDNIIMSINSDE